MKKILYIANYKGPVGGISGQVSLLQQHVQQMGYDADIFSTRGNMLQRLCHFFQLLWKAKDYDILHIHGCSGWGFLPIVYGVIAGKLWRKRILVTYHGGDAAQFLQRHARFVRRWLRRADYVIVLSGYLEKVFRDCDIDCIVIPNILQDARGGIDRTGERHALAPRFISVRHLTPLYNIPCVLRAFERVQREIPEASLALLGRGNMREELESWTVAHGLKNVQFVGQVPQDQVAAYLEQADVLLSAPRIDNMPVSVMEAMQTGLLVISSNVGGVPYVVEDGVTGLLFPYDDDVQMAEKMVWAIRHPDNALQIINKAHIEVQRYSWPNIWKLLEPIYNE